MGPLFFAFFVYLYGTALVAAVPVGTAILSPRQLLGFLPPQVTPDSPPEIIPSQTLPLVTLPEIHTHLGIPTISTTLTETSTTTSTVPSSTTTRTFIEQSIVTTATSTFVISRTIETTLTPQTEVASPISTPSVAAETSGTKGNRIVGFGTWDGGIAVRLGWAAILGLFLVVNPW